jgi:xylan 1,4-beta-xylosidase
MKKLMFLLNLFVLVGWTIVSAQGLKSVTKNQQTFCNPIDLNYRFQPRGIKAFREAADPLITQYKGSYFLFASHSGGYWYSNDMLDWKYIPIKSLPIENYAPDILIKGDTVFYTASTKKKDYIYYSTNLFEDSWKPMSRIFPLTYSDPHFFRDDDGKVFLYSGSSDIKPITVVQLNATNMQPIAEPVAVIPHNIAEHGWEIVLDANQKEKNGFNEGSWMTKYNNKYYLQYAAPATEDKTYADGVYTSDSPMGPFKYETYSPFSYKPGGFVGGTGHSSTFQDKYGNYWHVSTLLITNRSRVERRLGLFPASFDKDGVLRTYTAFGDYPATMPNRKINFEKESLFKGWMLLSYNKKASASSSMETFPIENAFDEDIRTWWSASTGNKNEWLSVELDNNVTINAIQLNFADNDAEIRSDSKTNLQYCYRILASNDQKSWKVVVDKSNNTKDACHEYIELSKPLNAKYIKIENVKIPDGKFSIYDLRIFGLKKGKTPKGVTKFEVNRNIDSRKALVKWTKDKSATGYIVNYGVDVNKLYTSYMVYDCDSVRLTGLNKDIPYYFSIDAFNESGITKGKKIFN